MQMLGPCFHSWPKNLMPDARLGDQYESREFGEERPEMGI